MKPLAWLVVLASSGLLSCAVNGANVATKKPVLTLLEMRQKNVVIQEWDLSCGAAALTTLLRYQHNLELSEKEVATQLINRQEYIDNPDLLQIKQGFSLLDLKRYVVSIGLQGDGFGQLVFEDLLDFAPIIVPVRLEDYNHFVVFRGVAGDRVLVADPAWGNRILTRSKFEQAWIEFDELGRIGFVVSSENTDPTMNKLLPHALDFVMLK